MFFDTHCHLDFAVFDSDRDVLMSQAQRLGIEQILIPGVSLQNFAKIEAIHAQWPDTIHFALGLHPCFIQEHSAQAVSRLADWLSRSRSVCALGEIGLDARPNQAPEAVQLMLLEEQLKLARERDLPVILHVVKAHERMLSLLKRYALPRGGVVHAYSGSLEQAKHYAKLGFKLGFGGAVTYDRAQRQHRMVRELPLDWMLLETDAPDMPLQGYQHQPNTPLRVIEVAQAIATLRGVSLETITTQTQHNAQQLFFSR